MGKIVVRTGLLLGLAILVAACQPPQVGQQPDILVNITADGLTQSITLPAGSTVQAALDTIGLVLGSGDRISPPVYAVLNDGDEILVARVQEEYETVSKTIPFERQELPNESMPAGESRLIQAGQNGESEVTIRRVYEDGVLTSETLVSETIIKKPVDEIVMVGVQSPFTTVSIPGKLVYLTGGNAWLMEDSTANRRPLVTSGDLDGRVLSLSPDGRWLLYTRKSSRPPDQEINTLWMININAQTAAPIDLRVANIVHFADWQPGEGYVIAYSTVEPRATAPGWQANNDLYLLPFDAEKGETGELTQVLESSSGGIYGWWGTDFFWSPDGIRLAYSRPDGIGLVDFENQALNSLVGITPLNTHSDWAWIPGLAWGSDSRTLYLVTHALSAGLANAEESPYFDLEALSLSTGIRAILFSQTGMFAYPVSSPLQNLGNENAYEIAFLQAIFPTQSASSRYRLSVMDRDGSESRLVFPSETQPGLEPQILAWAPEGGSRLIALLYDGNLWIIDVANGQAQQVTGDGLTSQIDWK
jgi:WD40 repeat protein